MKNNTSRVIALDREVMTQTERELLRRDFMRVAEEYFETQGQSVIDITRSDDGFSVCLIFNARRIKKVRSPQ